MAYAPAKLYRGVPATGTPVTVYTASGNVIVKSIVLTNTTATAALITGAIGGTNIFTSLSVPANSVTILESGELEVLASGETITLGQATASAITARVNGVTF